jgi:hypothetical protein
LDGTTAITDVEIDRVIIEERRRQRLDLARIEADLAYFQARLELIGEPTSANQRAQRKLFKLLHEQVGIRLARTRAAGGDPREQRPGQDDDGTHGQPNATD